jgi:guanylate kinase
MNKRGLLFIISGPAGSGKGTIVSRVRELAPFDFSVSATTRNPRPGEVDGVHYHFLTKEQFEEKIASGEMLEHAKYSENYYGTPKAPVDKALDEGKNIILEIEVQGALQVKEKMPEAIMIFIMPPNYETLLARIRGRGTETEEVIQKRMKQSHFEIENFHKYDYVVVNQTNGIEKAAENILDIMKVETLRTSRNLELAENFYN